MNLESYMQQVYEDAFMQMEETYNLLSWNDEWEDLCASSMVTGRENNRYCGIDYETACEMVKSLVWDYSFRSAFKDEMGCDIVECNEFDPIGFDVDVRLFCLNRLKDRLCKDYVIMTVFGE